jgi:hypothetical protein
VDLLGEKFELVHRRLDQMDARIGRVEDAVVRIDERMGRLEHSMSRFSLTVVVAMTVGFLGNITAVLVATG